MGDVEAQPGPELQPEVLLLLVLLTGISGLAALLFLALHGSRSTKLSYPMFPHPAQPLSMLVFVGLPACLVLMRLAVLFSHTFVPLDPINSPRSSYRYTEAPVELVLNDWESPQLYGYPENAADLTAQAAARIGQGSARQRAQAARDLAWWTGVCPNYAPMTLPRLTAALRDPDQGVKSAAVAGLVSIGGHASPAVPHLHAARGSSVPYFDHILDEAVSLIERGGKWPAEDVCETVAIGELERRAGTGGPAPHDPWGARPRR